MNKFLLFLIVISSSAIAQQKSEISNSWHLTIVNSVTFKGIDGVSVSVNKIRNYVTDSNGITDISKSVINSAIATIYISCIGYKSVTLTSKPNSTLPDTVRLATSVTELEEIKIKAVTSPKIVLGEIKELNESHFIPNPDWEFAKYIPNDKKIIGIIASVEFVLNDELHGIDKPFAVRLYSKNKDSFFPDSELTKDSIIVYNKKKARRISVDISRYKIKFPDNGVIAVFATLPVRYYGKDSIFYSKKPFVKGWCLKMPGIDIGLKKEGEYDVDRTSLARNGTYSMVRTSVDKNSLEDMKDQFFVYAEGNNFAISITISQ